MRLLIQRSDPRKANRGTAGDGEISEEGWRLEVVGGGEGGGVGVDDGRPATVSAAGTSDGERGMHQGFALCH